MTEAEWLTCADFRTMMNALHQRGSGRQRHLLSCACCRLTWHLLPVRCRELVEAVEQYADNEVSAGELTTRFEGHHSVPVARSRTAGGDQAAQAVAHLGCEWRREYQPTNPWQAWYRADQVARSAAEALAKTITWDEARQCELHLLRDIFGNTFHPVAINHEWLTSTVIALASRMYDTRDFSPMPILADAIQDAGCENDDILTHCRGNGPHVRGCWVVDGVLRKE